MRRGIGCLFLVLLAPVAGNTAGSRPVSFTTTEETWMNVDVVPGGRTLVFDLLGDIYTLPIGGGQAARLTDGRAYDMQPRWSPDGRSIAFTSDRSGSDNIWVMAADGSGPEAVTRDPRASRCMPHDLLDRVTTTRTVIADDQYLFRVAARGAEAVRKAGGRVAVGGHGNHPGLGPHWELWSFVEGGMAPLEALRAATAGGAELLGIQKDLGTLQPGLIADLVILNADPQADIHRTTDVFRVMKNGRMFDPDELAKRIKP